MTEDAMDDDKKFLRNYIPGLLFFFFPFCPPQPLLTRMTENAMDDDAKFLHNYILGNHADLFFLLLSQPLGTLLPEDAMHDNENFWRNFILGIFAQSHSRPSCRLCSFFLFNPALKTRCMTLRSSCN